MAVEGNKFLLGNVGGRPPKFETTEQLETKIIEYFDTCVIEYDHEGNWVSGSRPTVTGLTLFLGFADKKSLRQYKAKEGFAPLIKRALTAVEMSYEENLNSKFATGSIFALKNMDWKDQSQTDITTGGKEVSIPPISWVKNGE